MRELEQEYEGRAIFTIVSAKDTAAAADDIEAFGFTDLKHGLVVFDGDGEAKVKLPGHMFGRAEIEKGLKGVLGGEAAQQGDAADRLRRPLIAVALGVIKRGMQWQ